MPTFEETATTVLEQKRAGWRNEKHGKDWPKSLWLDVFSQLGDKPVSEITSADLLQVLAPIWHAKPETAHRVRQRIGAVMKWAVAMEALAGRHGNRCRRPDRSCRSPSGRLAARLLLMARAWRERPACEDATGDGAAS